MALVKESTHDFNSYVETNIERSWVQRWRVASMLIRDYKVTVNVGQLARCQKQKKREWQRKSKITIKSQSINGGFIVTKTLLQNPFNTMNKPKHISERALNQSTSEHIKAHFPKTSSVVFLGLVTSSSILYL